jgi:hypothetical protein
MALVVGCASEHGAVAPASSELACEPESLRSMWWSDNGGPFYGGTGEITLNAAGTHVLVEDMFRSVAVRLSDGTRNPTALTTVELTDVAGVRFAAQHMTMDAAGHDDYAGATDVLAVGNTTPLASVAWIVPRDASGYTQVAAHVAQSDDHAVLLESALVFGGTNRGVWLRRLRVSSPTVEQRVDLSSALAPTGNALDVPFTLLVDDAHGVAFVTNAPQAINPRITRVDPASGAIRSSALTVGAPAPIVNQGYLVAPGVMLLDTALSGDGSLVLTTTRDGVLHTLDAATLEDVGMPRTVGVVVANPETYLPTLRSPVAATEHGTFVAEVATDGRIQIVDTVTGRATTLVSASTARDLDGHPVTPRAIHLRFLADGLLVLSDAGIERFRCGS